MPKSTNYEIRLMVVLILFWGCIGLNRAGIGFIFPQIVPEFHMELWQAGLLISGTSITWAISSWGGGWLSDRYGRRIVLLPAAAFTCLATAAMGATWGFLSMFIVRDLVGIGDGIGWSVGEATVNEESAPQRRGLNQALFTAGYTLVGAGLGALIITSITAHLGWRWVFPIIAMATAVVVIVLAFVMREPPRQVAHRPTDWRAAIRLLRNRSMLLVTIMGCAILAWLQLSIGYNVLFLTKVRGFSLVEAGTVMSAWGLVGTVGQFLVPLASDYWGRRPVVLASALLCAAALLLYVFGGFGIGIMRLLLAASGFFGWGLLPIVIATCVSELVTEHQRGAALGMTNFFAVIVGTTIMPVVGGVIADHFGLASTIILAAAVQIVVAVLIMAIGETAPRVLARRAAAQA